MSRAEEKQWPPAALRWSIFILPGGKLPPGLYVLITLDEAEILRGAS